MSGFTSELWLCSPGPGTFIATDDDAGTVVNLGTFPAGTELIFCIKVLNSGQTYYTGPGTRNPDGIPHAAVDATGPGEAVVGSEDILGGGDLDYDDNVFRFTGVIPEPNEPPDCSAVTVDEDTLWPPSHKLRLVTLSGATDPDGDPVDLVVTGVTQDESLEGGEPDAVAGPAPNQVSVRSEREGSGDGRVYVISYTATDDSGATCSGTATVTVPHSQGSKGAAVDYGQAVGSFGP